jgi:NitT/TauT family transport system ATP-binding protein
MGTPRRERAERVAALLDKVGLTGHGDKYPTQLSGGMQQRVQIARCLAQGPRVLLMDEPFGALDALTRQALQDEIARLVRESGATVLFVTHDLDEAIYLGDRVFALEANPGRLAEVIEVGLARPRDQLQTREHPEFLRLRHVLFNHVQKTH